MASEIRVNSITNRSGLGTVTFSDTGVVLSGVSTFTVSSGSAAAPSISPSGDSNTGIFFPSPDTIAFAEGGVEALRIDSSGRLTLPYQPSFRVYNPAGAANSIITFGATEHNIGNHMNAATGVFTAPIAGRYLFTFAILSGNPYNTYVRINFCKNSTTIDTTLGDTLWDGLVTYGSPGMAMIFYLVANDAIRLKIEGSGVYGSTYGSFSGMFLG